MDFLPGVDGEGVPRVLASFMNALLRGQPLPLVDGGNQRRTFVSVHEFIDAVVRVVERRGACRGEVLNLGNPDNNVTIRALAESMASAFAGAHPLAPPARLRTVAAEELYGPGYDDTEERIPDITKARRLLGWNPRVPLPEMLPEIIDDYVARYRPRIALIEAEPATPAPLVQSASGGYRRR
jgi:UDP-apiose/xylose synthase